MTATENTTRELARISLVVGALLAMSSVILGAFGAHGLKNVLSVTSLNTFEIGVRYQMYHGLAILLLPALTPYTDKRWIYRVATSFIIGCILFSGSLYALATTGLKWLGPITPLGGLFFIAGWAMLAFALFRGPQVNKANNDE